MSKQNVLLAIHNFSEMESLANNAKIRSSLKFLLIRCISEKTFKMDTKQQSYVFYTRLLQTNGILTDLTFIAVLSIHESF